MIKCRKEVRFTPLRISNAQSASPCSVITAREAGVLNVQRCNCKGRSGYIQVKRKGGKKGKRSEKGRAKKGAGVKKGAGAKKGAKEKHSKNNYIITLKINT